MRILRRHHRHHHHRSHCHYRDHNRRRWRIVEQQQQQQHLCTRPDPTRISGSMHAVVRSQWSVGRGGRQCLGGARLVTGLYLFLFFYFFIFLFLFFSFRDDSPGRCCASGGRNPPPRVRRTLSFFLSFFLSFLPSFLPSLPPSASAPRVSHGRLARLFYFVLLCLSTNQ